IQALRPLFNLSGDFGQKVNRLGELLASSEEGKKGMDELLFIEDKIRQLGLKAATLDFDVTLARGLNYYTGCILEVTAPAGGAMGSIGGGGRYDDLTGIFGIKDLSGVGISFGLDRIYLVIESLGLFPERVSVSSKVLFLNYGDTESLYSMKAIQLLRMNEISAELYPDAIKIAKQFNYGDKRQIKFVVVAGSSEIAEKRFTVKNMESGE